MVGRYFSGNLIFEYLLWNFGFMLCSQSICTIREKYGHLNLDDRRSI